MSHIIYRIENDVGLGPYRNDTLRCRFGSIHQDDNHPNRHEDLKQIVPNDDILDNYYCGFHEYNLLGSWFELNHISYLLTMGYRIVTLEVKERIIGISGKQCFFKQEDIIQYLN